MVDWFYPIFSDMWSLQEIARRGHHGVKKRFFLLVVSYTALRLGVSLDIQVMLAKQAHEVVLNRYVSERLEAAMRLRP